MDLNERCRALSRVADILAILYDLAGEQDLADTHVMIAAELLKPDMPKEILEEYANALAESVIDTAPVLQSMLAHAENRVVKALPEPPTLRQLPQNCETQEFHEFADLAARFNMPRPRGVN